ncbi:hypothetical protein QBC34DRAFT_416982, partial [Podospora aff. communis PSN243]
MTTLPTHANPPSYTEHSLPEPIILSVSSTLFTTTIPTLTSRSTYFQSLFRTPDWKKSRQPHNGALFIDSDPEVFTHILQFLRRGVFPLSYDPKSGHNYKLYADILAEAQHFQIPKLTAWIAERLYIHCVTIYNEWRPDLRRGSSDEGLPQGSSSSAWSGDVIGTELVRDEVVTERMARCYHIAEKRHTCEKKSCSVGGRDDENDKYR